MSKCGENGGIEVTDDGNKNQKCTTCNKILRRNGMIQFWNWILCW